MGERRQVSCPCFAENLQRQRADPVSLASWCWWQRSGQGSCKKPFHAGREAGQDVRKYEILVAGQLYLRLLRGVNRYRLGLLVKDADPQDAGGEVFGYLGEDVAPAVAGGANLESDVGGYRKIALRK